MRNFNIPYLELRYNLKNPNPEKPVPVEKKSALIEMKVEDDSGPASSTPDLYTSEKYLIEFIDPAAEWKFKTKIWVGSDIEKINLYDRYIPDGELENFIRGSMIHQILDMKRFPHLTTLYRNDKINMVKLSKEETEFYHYLQLTKFLAMRSLNLTLFLKNGIKTIDHMYFLEQESKLDGSLSCSFIYKPKD